MKATYKSRWSDEEMAASVEAYVRMLRLQENGREFKIDMKELVV